jgi:hypothetical protein
LTCRVVFILSHGITELLALSTPLAKARESVFPATAWAEGRQLNGAPFPATASAEGGQFNGAPFPATASAEGGQFNGPPSSTGLKPRSFHGLKPMFL